MIEELVKRFISRRYWVWRYRTNGEFRVNPIKTIIYYLRRR
jgi:hypothetical protein